MSEIDADLMPMWIIACPKHGCVIWRPGYEYLGLLCTECRKTLRLPTR